jgi:4-oxalocrotonate tautomerase
MLSPVTSRKEATMPLIEINVFEDELSEQETQALIKSVTDSTVSVVGTALRPYTWVVVHQVRSGNWGIGGDALGLKNVRALQGRSD